MKSLNPPWAYVFVGALLLLAAGCRFDRKVSPGKRVTCSQTTDCPTGDVCRSTLGFCVRDNPADQTPPKPINVVATPTRLTHSGEVLVTWASDEALIGVPTVLWLSAGRAVDLGEAATQADGSFSVRFALPVDAVEGEAEFRVTMVDEAGNAASAVPLTRVTIDFTPPQVTAAYLVAPATGASMPVTLRQADTLVVRVVFSEPVDTARLFAAAVATTPSASCPPSPRPLSATDVGESAVELRREGTAASLGNTGCTYALYVDGISDRLGNAALLPTNGASIGISYRIDETPPMFLSSVDAWRETDAGRVPATVFSRNAGFERAGFGFDIDNTAVSAELRVGAARPATCARLDDFCRATANGYRCECSYPLSASDAEGPRAITAIAGDAAGNVVAQSGAVTFDYTPPAIIPSSVKVNFIAGAGNLAGAQGKLEAVGPLTSAGISLALTEVPAGTPVITFPGLMTQQSSAAGALQAFTVSYAAGVDAGCVQGTLKATDLAGNGSTNVVPLTAFGCNGVPILSSTRPLATNVAGAVKYFRQPGGTLDAGFAPRFFVQGTPGAAAGRGIVVVKDTKTPTEFGRASSDDAGAFGPIDLFPVADRPSVAVLFVDLAGNASPATKVLDVETTRRASFAVVVGDPGTPAPTLPSTVRAGWVSRVDTANSSTGNTLWWARATNQTFDKRLGQWVSYGAYCSNGPCSTYGAPSPYALVRESDGGVSAPWPAPGASEFDQLTFDENINASVRIGGGNACDPVSPPTCPVQGIKNPKREFVRLTDAGWVDAGTTGLPGPMFGPALVYNPAMKHTVLFSEFGTYIFDGGSWAPLTGATSGDAGLILSVELDDGGRAPGRYGAAMGYDPTSKRVLLFGGVASASAPVGQEAPWASGETWRLEYGPPPMWVKVLSMGTGNPSTEPAQGMAVDPATDRLYMFSATLAGEWTGSTWASTDAIQNWQAQLTIPTPDPPDGLYFSGAYSPYRLHIRRSTVRPVATLDFTDPYPGYPITSVTARIVGSGSGYERSPDGGWQPKPGFALLDLPDANYVDLDAGSSGAADAGSTFTYVTTRTAWSIAPRGTNGPGSAALSLQSAEAVITTRLVPDAGY